MSFSEQKDLYISTVGAVVETVIESRNTVLMYFGLKQVYNEILGTINITSDVSFSDSEESIGHDYTIIDNEVEEVEEDNSCDFDEDEEDEEDELPEDSLTEFMVEGENVKKEISKTQEQNTGHKAVNTLDDLDTLLEEYLDISE